MIKYIFSVIAMFSALHPVAAGTAVAPNGTETAEMAAVAQNQGLKEVQNIAVWVTAYSSTPEETDNTPFITAMGSQVRDGIVATNFLPFGTKVKIPEHFGNKIFTVEDRMHKRKTNFLDVWMPTKEDAKTFGINYTEIVILE